MDLTNRQQEILKEVIDTFIATAEPVGSKAIMAKLRKPPSSATIRNEMNTLEKLGLLEQPHTSAGRVPTGRGYRVYVDSLMEDYTLSFEETLLLNSLLSEKNKDPDRILSDMASLLARMTGYTVAAFIRERLGTIERFEGVYVNKGSFLLVMVTSSGKAVTKQFQPDLPLSAEGVRFIIKTLNEHLAKKELGGITLERIIAMESDLGKYRGLIAPLIQIIYDVMAEMGKETVMVKGIANLLSFPEFQSDGKCAALVKDLEDESALTARLQHDVSAGIRVHIASGGDGLKDTSSVTCPFRFRRNLEGAVCVIGPKRMDYGKAMARVEYLAKQIHAVHGFEPNLPLIET
ncbi:MAG: heat-inducible transcription repressor HrcA [Clostridia bacterium]|nr:heat-inducible transcription repressor HrcA [Clostridia bacterium]